MTVPFNQYYLNNIEATSVYEAGSKLTALGAVFGGIGTIYLGVAADIPFVGASEALINLESGELRKSYDVETGIVTLNLSVSAGMGFKIDSEGKEMPFGGNFDIVLESGRITLDNVGMKLLPGASMTVGKDATLELRGESRLFVYNNKDFEWTGDTNSSTTTKILNGQEIPIFPLIPVRLWLTPIAKNPRSIIILTVPHN